MNIFTTRLPSGKFAVMITAEASQIAVFNTAKEAEDLHTRLLGMSGKTSTGKRRGRPPMPKKVEVQKRQRLSKKPARPITVGKARKTTGRTTARTRSKAAEPPNAEQLGHQLAE